MNGGDCLNGMRGPDASAKANKTKEIHLVPRLAIYRLLFLMWDIKAQQYFIMIMICICWVVLFDCSLMFSALFIILLCIKKQIGGEPRNIFWMSALCICSPLIHTGGMGFRFRAYTRPQRELLSWSWGYTILCLLNKCKYTSGLRLLGLWSYHGRLSGPVLIMPYESHPIMFLLFAHAGSEVHVGTCSAWNLQLSSALSPFNQRCKVQAVWKC